jgi:hypothetical protein
VAIRKTLAQGAVSVYDNLDAIAGICERVFLILVAEFVRRGAWFSAFLLCVLAGVAWSWKITRKSPGPLISFVKNDGVQVRAKLVSLTKTIYKG